MALWDRISARGQVEDRRGMGPMAAGGISITGVALLLLFNLLTGGNLGDILYQLPAAVPTQQYQTDNKEFEGEDNYEVFASKVLGSNNQMWNQLFSDAGQSYTEPRLVLFRALTASGCGNASSDVGPHYCPLDNTIYLDETFFDELRNRFGAQGGDVAEAYVIAHEVAHHAQNELGIMNEANRQASNNPDNANDISIRMELQADCFAGLWANSVKDTEVFLPGEINEAVDAASAVGDDRVQQKVTGYINPENWTHGSSAQRVNWFNRGYNTGLLKECDTFSSSSL